MLRREIFITYCLILNGGWIVTKCEQSSDHGSYTVELKDPDPNSKAERVLILTPGFPHRSQCIEYNPYTDRLDRPRFRIM